MRRPSVGPTPGGIDPASGLARLAAHVEPELLGLARSLIASATSPRCCTVSRLQGGRRHLPEVARLAPEVLEVARVGHGQALVQDREGVHAHRAVAEPRARREPHTGHLDEGVALLVVEALVHVPAAPGFDRVDDLVETVAEDPLRVHADGEHVRNRHRRADDVRHEPVPYARGVLGPADRAVATAAAAVARTRTVGAGRTSPPRSPVSAARPPRWPGRPRWWGRPTNPGSPEAPPPLVSTKYAPLAIEKPILSRSPIAAWARCSLSGTGVMCWKNRPSYCSDGGR